MRRMTRFWMDGKEYEAPDIWLYVHMEKRTKAGMGVQQASLESMKYWAEQTDLMEDAQ